MSKIWCEIMERYFIEGQCPYDKGQAQPDNPTCPKCRHYISLQQAPKRDDQVETPKEKSAEGETPSTESHQRKAIRVKMMSLDKELKKRGLYRWQFIRRNKELFQDLKKQREQHYLKLKSRRRSSSLNLTSFLEEDSLLKENFLKLFPANFFPYFMEFSSFEIPKTAPTSLPEIMLYDLSPIEVLFYGEDDKDRVTTSISSFYPEGNEKFLQGAVESRKAAMQKSRKTRFPILSIDAVNKENKTVIIKIHLDRKKKEILRDMGLFLDILKREAKDYNVDLKRPKPHWDIYDKFLKVHDLRTEDRKKWSWSKIAGKMFPGEPLRSAIDRVRHYDRQAKKMISGGWRQI